MNGLRNACSAIFVLVSLSPVLGDSNDSGSKPEIPFKDRGGWIEIFQRKDGRMWASSTVRKDRIAHLVVENKMKGKNRGDALFFVRVFLSDVDGGQHGQRYFASYEMGNRFETERFLKDWRESL
jgi:hypothetical protein